VRENIRHDLRPVGGLVLPIYKADRGSAKLGSAITSSLETIFAPSSAAGRAAVAVIRLSGPACASVCQRLTGRPPPPARRAALRRLRDPENLEIFDHGLVLWFPGPASFTGEDVLELQVHGSRAVLAGLLDGLASLPGLRPAEPGEFSKRAFLNGRLDLTAAEGLADLIAAETRAQARQALRQLDGALGRLYDDWRQRLLEALARLEAAIDFSPEEADVPPDLLAVVRPGIERLAAEIAAHLADRRRGERLRDGLTIAVLGPPNAGKSTLVNRLAQRDVAIVTPEPGTTRDVLEVHLDLGGYPVTVLDTAGLRQPVDAIEAEGVRRAQQRAIHADLRLLLFDGALWPDFDLATLTLAGDEALCVVNKADLASLPAMLRIGEHPALSLSCRTGEGFDHLLEALGAAAAERLSPAGGPMPTRSRHRAALRAALEALERFRLAPAGAELALLAEDLRLAARALGRLTGRVGVEDILDLIFAEFCVGK
jgi:tRNA modification GTPase